MIFFQKQQIKENQKHYEKIFILQENFQVRKKKNRLGVRLTLEISFHIRIRRILFWTLTTNIDVCLTNILYTYTFLWMLLLFY